MLNIIKQKNKNLEKSLNNKTKSTVRDSNYLDIVKQFPASTKEWYNSIYTYNKNSTKLLPAHDTMVIKLIKGYFNLYKTRLKTRYIIRRLRKYFIQSSKRIFVSKAELKHTNDKVTITLYIYNEQERYLVNKLKKIDPSSGIKNKKFLRRIKLIKHQGLNIINLLKIEKNFFNYKEKKIIDKFKYHEIRSYKNFISKSLNKDNLVKFYIGKLGFNRRKFENTYILPLNKLLNNVYNKKVEFNLIKLKYFYLDSNILSQAIAIKIRKKKNLLKIFKSCLKLVKLPLLTKFRYKFNFNSLYITSTSAKLKYFESINPCIYRNISTKNTDILHQLVQIFNKKKHISNYVETAILSSIKLKPVNGIRLEASGRLSKRFTASRSIFKVKYKGSLKNIHSSYKGLPSVMLRGYSRSNLQYTNITSRTRNGSFGLKGWISSE